MYIIQQRHLFVKPNQNQFDPNEKFSLHDIHWMYLGKTHTNDIECKCLILSLMYPTKPFIASGKGHFRQPFLFNSNTYTVDS